MTVPLSLADPDADALLALGQVTRRVHLLTLDTGLLTAEEIASYAYAPDPSEFCSCDGTRCIEEGCLDEIPVAYWKGRFAYDLVFPLDGTPTADATEVTVVFSRMFTETLLVADLDFPAESLLDVETLAEILDDPSDGAESIEVTEVTETWRLARDESGRPVAAVVSGEYEIARDSYDTGVDEHLVA